jgi:hypothetical protein
MSLVVKSQLETKTFKLLILFEHILMHNPTYTSRNFEDRLVTSVYNKVEGGGSTKDDRQNKLAKIARGMRCSNHRMGN